MGLKGKDGPTKLAMFWGAEKAVRGLFGVYARAIGLCEDPAMRHFLMEQRAR